MKKRIGDVLMEKGLIREEQIADIVSYSKRTGLRFGESGMEMGLFTRQDLVRVFGPSFNVDFFYLDPAYFPQVTRDFLPMDLMIQHGVLPLGIKKEYRFFRARKRLNLGFLDPGKRGVIHEIEEKARDSFEKNGIKGVKIYLVLADQFLDVLHDVYHLPEADLLKKDPSSVDETLQMFLEGAS